MNPPEFVVTKSEQHFKLIGYTILENEEPAKGFRGTNIHVYQTKGIADRYAKGRMVRPVYVRVEE